MRQFIFPILAALMVITNWTPQLQAQSSMSAFEREELIGQLKDALAKLESEENADSGEIEGTLSTDRVAANTLSGMGSYRTQSAGSGTRSGDVAGNANVYGGSNGGVSNGGGQYISGNSGYTSALPIEGYFGGQGLSQAQISSLPWAAPLDAAPAFQQAAPLAQAPLSYAAPVEFAQPMMFAQPAPVAPVINVTVNPAPVIVVQQAAPSFQPMFMNYVPAPVPFQAPRRHKCCLFGR